MQTFEIFFSKIIEQSSLILHTNIPCVCCVCVILVCSNGGATYIVREIIAKDSLNIENLMPTFENLLPKLHVLAKFLDIGHK